MLIRLANHFGTVRVRARRTRRAARHQVLGLAGHLGLDGA